MAEAALKLDAILLNGGVDAMSGGDSGDDDSIGINGSSGSLNNNNGGSGGKQHTCQVCHEDILKFKGLHYGAMTCYSCRAFFRRCHSADRKEPFKATCKNQVGFDCWNCMHFLGKKYYLKFFFASIMFPGF